MTYDEIEETIRREAMKRFLVELEKKGFNLREAYDHGITLEWAEWLEGWGVPVSAWRRVIHPPQVLHKRRNLSILDNRNMEQAHKLAISRGRSSSKVDPAFKSAYRSKGFTLTSLAAAAECDAPLLSKYRRKLRRIPEERAERIAKLIPWPADAKHWPGGIVPKD